MNDATRHYDEWPTRMNAMKAAAPDVARAFGGMYQKLMGDGALSVRDKELISIGIGMAIRCDKCVYAHVEKALQAGVTREELIELAGVVVVMQGGPGYVSVPMLIDAIDAVEAPATTG